MTTLGHRLPHPTPRSRPTGTRTSSPQPARSSPYRAATPPYRAATPPPPRRTDASTPDNLAALAEAGLLDVASRHAVLSPDLAREAYGRLLTGIDEPRHRSDSRTP